MKYEKPDMEILKLEIADIVRTSDDDLVIDDPERPYF